MLISQEKSWSAMLWALGRSVSRVACHAPTVVANATVWRQRSGHPGLRRPDPVRGLIPATIWACRCFGRRAPLLALALLSFNPVVFYHAATLRAYGLAALTAVLCLGATWRFITVPSRWTAGAAIAAMLFSVHSNYHNCYILFATGVAAAASCLMIKLWRALPLFWRCASSPRSR